jgi:hypothetical protein
MLLKKLFKYGVFVLPPLLGLAVTLGPGDLARASTVSEGDSTSIGLNLKSAALVTVFFGTGPGGDSMVCLESYAPNFVPTELFNRTTWGAGLSQGYCHSRSAAGLVSETDLSTASATVLSSLNQVSMVSLDRAELVDPNDPSSAGLFASSGGMANVVEVLSQIDVHYAHRSPSKEGMWARIGHLLHQGGASFYSALISPAEAQFAPGSAQSLIRQALRIIDTVYYQRAYLKPLRDFPRKALDTTLARHVTAAEAEAMIWKPFDVTVKRCKSITNPRGPACKSYNRVIAVGMDTQGNVAGVKLMTPEKAREIFKPF